MNEKILRHNKKSELIDSSYRKVKKLCKINKFIYYIFRGWSEKVNLWWCNIYNLKTCNWVFLQCMADDDCCGTLICNKWAYRCTKPKVIGFNASPQDGQDGGEWMIDWHGFYCTGWRFNLLFSKKIKIYLM